MLYCLFAVQHHNAGHLYPIVRLIVLKVLKYSHLALGNSSFDKGGDETNRDLSRQNFTALTNSIPVY